MIRAASLLLGLFAVVVGILGSVGAEATTYRQASASEVPQRLVVFEIFTRAA